MHILATLTDTFQNRTRGGMPQMAQCMGHRLVKVTNFMGRKNRGFSAVGLSHIAYRILVNLNIAIKALCELNRLY